MMPRGSSLDSEIPSSMPSKICSNGISSNPYSSEIKNITQIDNYCEEDEDEGGAASPQFEEPPMINDLVQKQNK